MDESMNIQPRDMYVVSISSLYCLTINEPTNSYLNATSMLNNWLFRVAIVKYETVDGHRLVFEHPAPVGVVNRPGWMEVGD